MDFIFLLGLIDRVMKIIGISEDRYLDMKFIKFLSATSLARALLVESIKEGMMITIIKSRVVLKS